jgi:hypothetical protein
MRLPCIRGTSGPRALRSGNVCRNDSRSLEHHRARAQSCTRIHEHLTSRKSCHELRVPRARTVAHLRSRAPVRANLPRWRQSAARPECSNSGRATRRPETGANFGHCCQARLLLGTGALRSPRRRPEATQGFQVMYRWRGAAAWPCAVLAFVMLACVSTELGAGPGHPASPEAEAAPLPAMGALLEQSSAQSSSPPESSPGHNHEAPQAASEDSSPDETKQWTCPMHPEVIRSEPGECPICGMKLVPREKQDAPP